MDESMPNTKAPIDPFGMIMELHAELVATKALVEEYKAKIAKVELENMEKQNIMNALCIPTH
jgi:hypothetical protein